MESEDREQRTQPGSADGDERLAWVRVGLQAQGIVFDEADVASVASIYQEYERLAAELNAVKLAAGQPSALALDLQS